MWEEGRPVKHILTVSYYEIWSRLQEWAEYWIVLSVPTLYLSWSCHEAFWSFFLPEIKPLKLGGGKTSKSSSTVSFYEIWPNVQGWTEYWTVLSVCTYSKLKLELPRSFLVTFCQKLNRWNWAEERPVKIFRAVSFYKCVTCNTGILLSLVSFER